MEARLQQAEAFLNSLLEQEDIFRATQANLQQFDQSVVQALDAMIKKATEENNEAKLAKLQQVVAVLQQASGPLPEYEFIEQLLSAKNEAALEAMLAENEDKLTDELMQTLGGIVAQSQGQEANMSAQDQATFAKIGEVYNAVMKFQMKKNMAG